MNSKRSNKRAVRARLPIPRTQDAQDDDDDGGLGRTSLLIAGGLLLFGIGGYVAVNALVSEPEPEAPGPNGPLVETVRAEAVERLEIAQTGFVRPLADLSLTAEVSGRVAEIDPDFRVGARVAEGTVLVGLRRERFDAEFAAAEARRTGARARLQNALTEFERQRELDDQGFAADASVDETAAAVLSAEAELDLATSDVELARITLEDTSIKAPYDAVVTARQISLGQVVRPGTTVGSLVRADTAEIEIGLLPRQRTLLGDERVLLGRAVRIVPPGENLQIAEGRVRAVDPVIDPVTRTLGVIVAVEQPFAGERPLRIGELVEVIVPVHDGPATPLVVPAAALRGSDRLWRVTERNTLEGLEPDILRRDGDRAWVTADGLAAGDRLLLTDIPAPAPGLAVRIAPSERSSDEARSGG